MGTKEIYDLLKRYREHQCTPEEEEQVMRWYDQFNDDVENLPEIPEGKLAQFVVFHSSKDKQYHPKASCTCIFSICRGDCHIIYRGGGCILF